MGEVEDCVAGGWEVEGGAGEGAQRQFWVLGVMAKGREGERKWRLVVCVCVCVVCGVMMGGG